MKEQSELQIISAALLSFVYATNEMGQGTLVKKGIDLYQAIPFEAGAFFRNYTSSFAGAYCALYMLNTFYRLMPENISSKNPRLATLTACAGLVGWECITNMPEQVFDLGDAIAYLLAIGAYLHMHRDGAVKNDVIENVPVENKKGRTFARPYIS